MLYGIFLLYLHNYSEGNLPPVWFSTLLLLGREETKWDRCKNQWKSLLATRLCSHMVINYHNINSNSKTNDKAKGIITIQKQEYYEHFQNSSVRI